MGPTPIVDSGCLLLKDILTTYYTWDAHWVELSPNLWTWSGRFSNLRPTAWDDNQQELSVSTTTGLVIKGKPWKTDQIRNPHPTPGDELRRWVRFEDGFPLKHVLCAFSGDVDFQVPAMHIGPLGSPQKGALHQETGTRNPSWSRFRTGSQWFIIIFIHFRHQGIDVVSSRAPQLLLSGCLT